MNTTAFCYWLQGLFELANPETLDANQTELIKRHLSMVFQHDIDQRIPPEQQAKQQAIHDGPPVPVQKPSWAGGMSKEDYEKNGRPRC
jgi:hypothetical protein